MSNKITVTGGDMIFIWAYLQMPHYAVIMHSIDTCIRLYGPSFAFAGIDEYLVAYMKDY